MLQNKVQEAKANLKDGMYSQDSIHNVTTKSGYLNSRQVPYFCSLF